jgi:dihydrofolate reductase
MREIVYFVASTVDGFIAHQDGSFTGFPWDEHFGADLRARFPETFPAHLGGPARPGEANRTFDTVLMGRRTYEVALREGVTSPYPSMAQYVFSRTLVRSPDLQVTLTAEDPVTVAGDLKGQPGKGIWLCGGAVLSSALFTAGLVDRLIVKLNPVVFGAGTPLLGSASAQRALTLTESYVYAGGSRASVLQGHMASHGRAMARRHEGQRNPKVKMHRQFHGFASSIVRAVDRSQCYRALHTARRFRHAMDAAVPCDSTSPLASFNTSLQSRVVTNRKTRVLNARLLALHTRRFSSAV